MQIAELLNIGNVQISCTPADLVAFGRELGATILAESKQKNEDAGKTIPLAAAAEMLKVSKMTLYRWEREKYLMPVRRGKRIYYNLSDVKQIMGGE